MPAEKPSIASIILLFTLLKQKTAAAPKAVVNQVKVEPKNPKK